ncbi:extracellular cell wall glucanase crf1 allergen asp f9 [Diaporthe amygdali]|uniref:extracellular cell wall glucanase crf1 allergen asp f9 n=1 Tax=Phomopsis amygdali TaxID=1214568 RepID=UPI0022FED2F6|nr:extracellular cell wall glucanase crf1 allergen asp f9 [Diaporthe amygdali]KAJ0118626.1 extracellular cell wall glucanase crf1 allergen asp f9 [Diaporthe amygdali]
MQNVNHYQTETCAPIPGIVSPFRTDFTKISTADVANNGWTIANYATFRTDSANGGVFPIEKRFDAPYIWTTAYFLYGKVDVQLQAAPGAGVITSAVLMSDTADEVDWEWSGNDYAQKQPTVQTNYFGKGITGSYDRSTFVSPGFNMTTGLHTYGIDWSADSLTWSIDGKAVRTLYKKNCDNDQHQYPQTPSRFHLGVWVAGDPSKPPGVIQWAGGLADFTRLPYTAYVKSVNLVPQSKCAYFNYTDKTGSSNSVQCLNELPKSLSTILSSTALNTLSAAPPAPSTTTKDTSTLSASSSQFLSSSRVAGGANTTNTANGGSAQASRSTGSVQLTTSTVYKTTIYETVTSCNSTVTNCPANKPLTSTVLVTDVVVDYTTVCPVTEDKSQSSAPKSSSTEPGSKAPSPSAGHTTSLSTTGGQTPGSKPSSSMGEATSLSLKDSSSIKTPGQTTSSEDSARQESRKLPASPSPQTSTIPKDSSGKVTGSQSKQSSVLSGNTPEASSKQPELTTSTVYSTNIYTVTSCGPEVKNCPAKSTVVTTEVVAAYTTVCPVTSTSGVSPGGSPGVSTGNPSETHPSESAPPLSSSTSNTPKEGSEKQSSQTIFQGNGSESLTSSSTISPPKDGSQKQSQIVSSGKPGETHTGSDSPSLPASTTVAPENGSGTQSEKGTSSTNPSESRVSDGTPPQSSSTVIPPNEVHAMPSLTSLAGSHDATTSMNYGQPTASLYNTDTELKLSGSLSQSAPPSAATPADKSGDASPSAHNSAHESTDSSGAAAEQGSAPPPGASPGPDGSVPVPAAGAVDSHSSTGLAHPVPADSGSPTIRSTITRTTTIRLTSTRQSTSTLYTTSATVITACNPGKSGADCSTISSTTTVVASKLVTPVAFTTTDVVATTEVTEAPVAGNALSSAAAQGASGVAGSGTGTGTGQLPAGPKTTALATIAGSGRNFEVVPGFVFAFILAVHLI